MDVAILICVQVSLILMVAISHIMLNMVQTLYKPFLYCYFNIQSEINIFAFQMGETYFKIFCLSGLSSYFIKVKFQVIFYYYYSFHLIFSKILFSSKRKRERNKYDLFYLNLLRYYFQQNQKMLFILFKFMKILKMFRLKFCIYIYIYSCY